MWGGWGSEIGGGGLVTAGGGWWGGVSGGGVRAAYYQGALDSAVVPPWGEGCVLSRCARF